MLVLDASAAVELALATARSEALERRTANGSLHAPQLLDVEVAHALRRLELAGAITRDRATAGIAFVDQLDVVRYDHTDLLPRAWQLRHNHTIYDGVYLALAEALDAVLITCDRALVRAAHHGARVELI